MPTCCGDPWQFWWVVVPIMIAVTAAGMVGLVALADRAMVRPMAIAMLFIVPMSWSIVLPFMEW